MSFELAHDLEGVEVEVGEVHHIEDAFVLQFRVGGESAPVSLGEGVPQVFVLGLFKGHQNNDSLASDFETAYGAWKRGEGFWLQVYNSATRIMELPGKK